MQQDSTSFTSDPKNIFQSSQDEENFYTERFSKKTSTMMSELFWLSM